MRLYTLTICVAGDDEPKVYVATSKERLFQQLEENAREAWESQQSDDKLPAERMAAIERYYNFWHDEWYVLDETELLE